MAVEYDITIDRGATYILSILVEDGYGTPIDLTGMTFKSAAKSTYLDASASFVFTASAAAPQTGQFQIELSADDCATINAGYYVYDVQMISGSYVSRLVQGSILISPEVTQ